ncbi:unnamed protein product, partial [Didymodactylos carnosus]
MGAKPTSIPEKQIISSGDTVRTLPASQTSDTIVRPWTPRIPAVSVNSTVNREDITILWVGSLPKSYSKEKLTKRLQKINSSVKIYDENIGLSDGQSASSAADSCMKDSLDYIQLLEKEKAVIILSSSNQMTLELVKDYLAEVNQKRQTASILVFDTKEHTDNLNYTSYSKVSHFMRLDKLLIETEEQIKSMIHEALAFSLFDKKQRATKDLTKESASFLWFQVLVDTLKKMPKHKNSLKEMLNMCRSYYIKQKTNYAADIAEFDRDYRPDDAIKWYTKETFLYKLLNKALRTEDVNALYLFRTFIVDLCDQLEEKFKTLKQTEVELTLYRGQYMSENEIDKLQHNQHSLISTNGFFSTTRGKDIAMSFANKHNCRTDVTSVLFEIRASTKLKKVVFADIAAIGAFDYEKEVLFSIGAVFLIDEVFYDTRDKIYKVHMTATDDGSKSLRLINRGTESGTRILFGELLLDMGKYTDSQQYFENLRAKMNADDVESANIYHNLGRAYGYKGEYDKALNNFKRAYEIRQKTLSKDDYLLADTLNSIGVIYSEKGEYEKARKKFNDALEMQKKYPSDDTEAKMLHISQSLSNIGSIHFLKGEYDKALEFQETSISERKKLLGEDNLLLAENYSSIGGIHHAKGEFDKATESYNEALKIGEANLPSNHPSIALNYQAIGKVLHENGRYEEALMYYNLALNIRTEALGRNHSSVASVYKSIGGVYLDKGAYAQALTQYVRARDICMTTLSENHPSTGDCYHSLGMLCERQEHFAEALAHYTKAREILSKLLPVDHPLVAKIWASIANVKLREGAYSEAIGIYESVLEIQRVIGEEHPDIILTYNCFGVLYRLQENYVEAKEYFQNALNMCKKYFVQDHPLKARILHNMGDMYTEMEDFDKAIDHYVQAYKMREATLPPDDISTASTYHNLG